ncbi:3-oxoacyl-ACP synthase [Candidatus Marinamargulisbacteria bacterium SCGC AG-343-D04]|nr:3-oxoacyl-ACP synthase [Candidatus Marinamargulisbacteria bacterium SCGC AG-343-D04]
MKARISGLGHALGEQETHNHYFVDLGLETSDEWITERTGIKSRYIASEETSTSDLATKAAQHCIQNASIDKSNIDLIIVATSTPDYLSFPSTACLVQEKLKLGPIGAFDLSAACSGFSFALSTARSFIESNMYKNILVIGADCLSKITNFEDRGTCILFADGAGAALVTQTVEGETGGIIDSSLHSDGSKAELLMIPKGGSKYPLNTSITDEKSHYITMDGKGVFKSAISIVIPAIKSMLNKHNLNINDLSYLVCHQANKRILDKIANSIGLDKDKLVVNVTKYGNTSAATIPIALSELNEEKKLQKGDLILLAGFGAGFTWGLNLIEWS